MKSNWKLILIAGSLLAIASFAIGCGGGEETQTHTPVARVGVPLVTDGGSLVSKGPDTCDPINASSRWSKYYICLAPRSVVRLKALYEPNLVVVITNHPASEGDDNGSTEINFEGTSPTPKPPEHHTLSYGGLWFGRSNSGYLAVHLNPEQIEEYDRAWDFISLE